MNERNELKKSSKAAKAVAINLFCQGRFSQAATAMLAHLDYETQLAAQRHAVFSEAARRLAD